MVEVADMQVLANVVAERMGAVPGLRDTLTCVAMADDSGCWACQVPSNSSESFISKVKRDALASHGRLVVRGVA